MERSWLIDSKGIATKVKCAGLPPADQLKDCGARRKCPNCHYIIDNSDVPLDWPGFPVGVKFDPSDIELLDHLAEKCGVGKFVQHMFIDDFIPTVDKEGGICYAHPEDLPGTRKDGSSAHFFHRITNAYASGQRKRRKILKSQNSEDVRWHKTGKTKHVTESGVHKGWKKIMVLYQITKKGYKPEKTKWVMHQYHLGTDEDEPEGQFVVSKIFYQQPKPKLKENDVKFGMTGYSDFNMRNSPRTPTANNSNPPRSGVFTPDDFTDVYAAQSPDEHTLKQESEFLKEIPNSSRVAEFTDNVETQTWLAGLSQAIDDFDFDDTLLCDENFTSHFDLDNFGLNDFSLDRFGHFTNDASDPSRNASNRVCDLENLKFDSTPDIQLKDLPFGSQENIFGWLHR